MDELWGFFIANWWMPVAHGLLSGFVGVSVFWLTSTMLSRHFSSKIKIGGFSIRGFSLAVASCFAILVHLLEDYTVKWF
jgi:hypothetical protein